VLRKQAEFGGDEEARCRGGEWKRDDEDVELCSDVFVVLENQAVGMVPDGSPVPVRLCRRGCAAEGGEEVGD